MSYYSDCFGGKKEDRREEEKKKPKRKKAERMKQRRPRPSMIYSLPSSLYNNKLTATKPNTEQQFTLYVQYNDKEKGRKSK
jgi:hypothetical protein